MNKYVFNAIMFCLACALFNSGCENPEKENKSLGEKDLPASVSPDENSSQSHSADPASETGIEAFFNYSVHDYALRLKKTQDCKWSLDYVYENSSLREIHRWKTDTAADATFVTVAEEGRSTDPKTGVFKWVRFKTPGSVIKNGRLQKGLLIEVWYDVKKLKKDYLHLMYPTAIYGGKLPLPTAAVKMQRVSEKSRSASLTPLLNQKQLKILYPWRKTEAGE